MAVEWRTLTEEDLGGVAELAQRCQAADGGLPWTVSASFLGQRYAGDGGVAVGATVGGRLVAAGALRPTDGGPAVVGHVDPAHRGSGLGADLLDRLLSQANGRPGEVSVETEALSIGADELFRSRGLQQTFAEDVMRRDLSEPFPACPLPAGVSISEWTDRDQSDFFTAYEQAFADRIGMPGWSQARWVDWMVDDEFLPSCSLLARAADGTPAGFVTCARGYLIQIGVLPAWRRRGLSRALAVAALTRMHGYDIGEVFLDVNVTNPASAALFQGLGFVAVTRRSRYQRSPT
jgi:mycothiol synthase